MSTSAGVEHNLLGQAVFPIKGRVRICPEIHAENILAAQKLAPILRAPRIRCVRNLDTGLSGFLVARILRSGGLYFNDHAHDQSAHSERTKKGLGEIKITGAEELSATPRRLHASDDADAKETELRIAQGGESAFDEWPGNHSLHPRRRTQPAGTLNRARARGSCEGFAGRALPHCSWNAR